MVFFIRNILSVLPNPVLEISYESLCKNKSNMLGTIANFLEVSENEINYSSDLKKINSGNYPQKISNYEQVEKTLSGTRFQYLLI